MKKTKKNVKKPKLRFVWPSVRAVVVITWMVFMTAAVALALLWSWDSFRINQYNSSAEWPRLVQQSMKDSYRQPVVSAAEKLFILPELNIALPYDDQFTQLQYSAYTDDEYQEATLTTSDIIVASTQTRGTPDSAGSLALPFFYCNRVITVTTQESQEFPALLDSFALSDGRTLYVYQNDREGTDCDTVYDKLDTDDFLQLISGARPYNL